MKKSWDKEKPQSNETHKLQKVLAQAGLGSRREMEQWIADGRVKVNGKVAELGLRVTGREKIQAGGRMVRVKQQEEIRRRVIVYHKKEGEVCSHKDEKGRKTVFDSFSRVKRGRWIMIGRLDFNTTGLLLFTNDGELANRLMHPKYQIEREYAVRVFGEVTNEMLQQLRDGVELEDGLAKFDNIIDGGGEGINHWYHVILREGRNREVRRMWESLDVKVSRLMRVRYGNIVLPKRIRLGKSIELEPEDVKALSKLVEL